MDAKTLIPLIAERPGVDCNGLAEIVGLEPKEVAGALSHLTQDALVRREGRGGPQDPFRYYPAMPASVAPVAIRKHRERKPGEALIVVPLRKRETLTLTVDEAHELLSSLLNMVRKFGGAK